MPVYLDHNATTALDPEVLDAMLPYMQGIHGNPSSVHRYGRLTRDAIESARAQLAKLIDAQPEQVIFTSGGTEANNMAIAGTLTGRISPVLAVSAIEHASILSVAESVTSARGKLVKIAVNPAGQVTEETLAEALASQPALVSIMLANNETGVIQPVKQLASNVHAGSSLFHTDGCQAVGKIPVSYRELDVDLLTLSGHKFYGPQGSGALVYKRHVDIKPILYGGGQEKGFRSGTENIAAIVGLGKAAELAGQRLDTEAGQIASLRDQLEQGLRQMPQVQLFVPEGIPRLPNTLQFAVENYDGEALLMALDRKGFAVSSGSACDSGKHEASHVLLAMGVDPAIAGGAIRVSLGRHNTKQEVAAFLAELKHIVN